MSLPPQTTGFLATECPSCDGTGDIVVKRGLEQLPWRYDCDDCRSTGWVIHDDTPAISIEAAIKAVATTPLLPIENFSERAEAALAGAFEEAR